MTDEHDSTQLKHALGEPPRDIPADVLVALESRLVVADEAPSAPAAPVLDELPLPVLDLNTVQERYPSLRNAL